MTWTSVTNKIFPIVVLLLAVTLNSFSAMKKAAVSQDLSFSTQHSDSHQSKRADTEAPQSTEKQENDDKLEDSDDPFVVEYFNTRYINHQFNHIYEFQIAVYHQHHRVIFVPPPQA